MDLPKIVIDTVVNDIHALAVSWALEEKGVPVTSLFGDDFPGSSRISLRPSGRGGAVRIDTPTGELEFEADSAVTYWVRRRSGPIIGSAVIAEDQKVALREAEAMLTSARLIISESSRTSCVNPAAGRRRAAAKPLQLCVAMAQGFRTPQSLMSNDRQEIGQFLLAANHRYVFKTFCPAFWRNENDEKGYSSLAALVDDSMLPAQDIVQNSPAIYQEYIEKCFEVRVVAMGATLFATRLDSQSIPHSEIDWRGYVAGVPQEPIDVPLDISRKCRGFMKDLGIVFGCFDFVVTHGGEWVFLECNEQGQWLWQESVCPQLPLLDAFSEFMLQPTLEFEYRAAQGRQGFSAFLASAAYANRSAFWARHQRQPEPFRSFEPAG